MNKLMVLLNNLVSVEFVFENCEGVIVENEDFIMFGVKSDKVKFAIHESCNRRYYNRYTGWNVLFDRLMKNDIAQIILKDKYFEKETLIVDWHDEYENTNKNQNTYINEFENLICEVKV